jgi:hypothetical protein
LGNSSLDQLCELYGYERLPLTFESRGSHVL